MAKTWGWIGAWALVVAGCSSSTAEPSTSSHEYAPPGTVLIDDCAFLQGGHIDDIGTADGGTQRECCFDGGCWVCSVTGPKAGICAP